MLEKNTTTSIGSYPAASAASAKKLVLLALILSAVSAFFYFDAGRYLTLEAVQSNRDRLLAFAENHLVSSGILFVVTYCVVTGLSLPGAVVLTLAGGFLFGSVLGTVLVNLGATSGATLAFLAARYLLRDWVESKFGDRLRPVQEGFARNDFGYLLTLRLIPLFPFFLVNLVSGLTRVRLRTYVAATALGIVPGSFVYAYAGRQLGTIDSLADVASPSVLLAFTFLGVLALLPKLYESYSRRRDPSP